MPYNSKNRPWDSQYRGGGYSKWKKIWNDSQSVTRGPSWERQGRSLEAPMADFDNHLGSPGRAAEHFGRYFVVQVAGRMPCFLSFWRRPAFLHLPIDFLWFWNGFGDRLLVFFHWRDLPNSEHAFDTFFIFLWIAFQIGEPSAICVLYNEYNGF